MNLFKKLFKRKSGDSPADLVENTLEGILEIANFDLSYELREVGDDTLEIELFGEDEEALKEKEGQLLDAFQFFMKRVTQHQFPDKHVHITFDSNGFREESSQALVDLADRLKDMAISKKRTVYCKALPPKDRRIIHQHLAEDKRVKTKSIGDGHYKKIKIFPVGSGSGNRRRHHGNRNRKQNNNQNVSSDNY